jgi:hypothetical protein
MPHEATIKSVCKMIHESGAEDILMSLGIWGEDGGVIYVTHQGKEYPCANIQSASDLVHRIIYGKDDEKIKVNT